MLIERDVAVPSRRVWLCFLSCFHIWRELLCVVLVSGMNKVTQYAWHSVLKGYESTFETHIPLKASQLLSVFWLFNCVQKPALRWGYRVTISCMTLLPEVSVNMFESNKNLRRSAGERKPADGTGGNITGRAYSSILLGTWCVAWEWEVKLLIILWGIGGGKKYTVIDILKIVFSLVFVFWHSFLIESEACSGKSR